MSLGGRSNQNKQVGDLDFDSLTSEEKCVSSI